MDDLILEEMQELADDLGFDLKKMVYGFQFRVGKLILNYYHTTGSVVTCKPKQAQKVKKNIPRNKIRSMLIELKGEIKDENIIDGEKAIALILAGIDVKHKRVGEDDWRRDDICKLPINSFINKTFVFKIGK